MSRRLRNQYGVKGIHFARLNPDGTYEESVEQPPKATKIDLPADAQSMVSSRVSFERPEGTPETVLGFVDGLPVATILDIEPMVIRIRLSSGHALPTELAQYEGGTVILTSPYSAKLPDFWASVCVALDASAKGERGELAIQRPEHLWKPIPTNPDETVIEPEDFDRPIDDYSTPFEQAVNGSFDLASVAWPFGGFSFGRVLPPRTEISSTKQPADPFPTEPLTLDDADSLGQLFGVPIFQNRKAFDDLFRMRFLKDAPHVDWAQVPEGNRLERTDLNTGVTETFYRPTVKVTTASDKAADIDPEALEQAMEDLAKHVQAQSEMAFLTGLRGRCSTKPTLKFDRDVDLFKTDQPIWKPWIRYGFEPWNTMPYASPVSYVGVSELAAGAGDTVANLLHLSPEDEQAYKDLLVAVTENDPPDEATVERLAEFIHRHVAAMVSEQLDDLVEAMLDLDLDPDTVSDITHLTGDNSDPSTPAT